MTVTSNLSLATCLCGVGYFYRYKKLHNVKRRSRRQLHFGFKIAASLTLLLYLVIPILYHFNSSVQRHLVFLPFVRWPAGINFSDPEAQGLLGCRNFYLMSQEDITIGVWHMLPRSLIQESKGKPTEFWEDAMKTSGKHVLIYFHGNTGSRAVQHRMELYLILQQLDYHVISFDYRGYADSTQVPPSETGVVTDGLAVYKYVQSVLSQANSDVNIFIWGHSLGTGVSSHVVSTLCTEGNPPTALFLESPFTSIGEEVKHHMLAAIYRYMPGFDYIFVKPLHRNDIAFESDRHIANINIPILILHATDDPVIPYFLGRKLHTIARRIRAGAAKPIYFKGFGNGFGHKFIYRSPELPQLIKNFVQCSVTDQWPCPGFNKSGSADVLEIEHKE